MFPAMRRRQLFPAFAALVALAALSGAALAGDAQVILEAAVARARRAGRPLFVIVVASQDLGDRGSAWGEVLAWADDATMARLGQCEVVCASEAQVTGVLGLDPGAWSWTVVPWLWVVPVAGAAVHAAPSLPARPGEGPVLDTLTAPMSGGAVHAAPNLPARPEPGGRLTAPVEAMDAALRAAPACLSADVGRDVSSMLEQVEPIAVAHDESSVADVMPFLDDGAAQLRAGWACADPAADTAPLARLDAALARANAVERSASDDASGDAWTTWVDARVAEMARMIEASVGGVLGPLDPAAIPGLAAAAIAALRTAPPPNARWGVASGCGASYEAAPGHPAQQENVDCGMGHVAPRAARFLDFLVT